MKTKIDNEEKIEAIVRELTKSGVKSRDDLASFKRKTAKKYKFPTPKNSALLKTYHELAKNGSLSIPLKKAREIEKTLIKRPVRSLSGIVNVSVLTKPFPCPGKCIFCPEQKGLPKSYLAKEPAVQRAVLNKFHPYKQVSARLQSLKATGHPIDKVELRIIGGTWSCYPKKYQTWFVKECFRAANQDPVSIKERAANQDPVSIKERAGLNQLDKIQKENERAKARIIGITTETRPDYINLNEIKRLRQLGVTRVELGVQSIFNDVLKLNKRGHGIKETIEATQMLKNAGLKVSYQIMPNLLGGNFKKDIQMFKALFQNQNFKPDLLKIYPLALVKQAPIYKLYKQKKYKPYSEKQLIKLLIEIKKYIPKWCRIERIVRDIPSSDIIEGGAKILNLRQVIQKTMAEKGQKCQCIRCREVGQSYDPKEKLKLFREDYQASGAKEVFLSFENKQRTKLYALLRLRLRAPNQFAGDVPLQILPVLKDTAIIREIHTYGPLAPIYGDRVSAVSAVQHKGLGQKLIKQAEKIAEQAGFKKIAVISGIGARGYYRKKLNYRLKDTYMVKKL